MNGSQKIQAPVVLHSNHYNIKDLLSKDWAVRSPIDGRLLKPSDPMLFWKLKKTQVDSGFLQIEACNKKVVKQSFKKRLVSSNHFLLETYA